MPTLSEADSKALLARHGVPVPAEALAASPAESAVAAARIGFPVVAKLCGAGLAHKTERGLVRLNLRDEAAVADAAAALLAAATPDDGDVGVLVGPMVSGLRELIAGLVRDPQFGPCVMLGVGGVLTEALGDVVFRLVPLTRADAAEMIDDLGTQGLLGPLRGEPAVDRERLVDVLVGLAAVAAAEPGIRSIDLNPLIVSAGTPVAVDALVETA
ncbi:MAG TPA: acetate--CoA ligase family protein [Acidimicrobiales bacterium]|nr:acetate--CoA ligase family protein [Acidimicrobiales bacterium]